MRYKAALCVTLAAILSIFTSVISQVKAQAPAITVVGPITKQAVAFGHSSASLNLLTSGSFVTSKTPNAAIGFDRFDRRSTNEEPNQRSGDGNVFSKPTGVPMPAPSLSFDGIANFDNVTIFNLLILPPDMNGDVGPDHYVQAVNSLIRIYDKSGKPLLPPFRISTLFAPLGTVCSTRNDGLPVVLYDQLADRWLISQVCSAFPPFRQMVAISKSGDPTGEYFAYEFVMPNVKINDFPKFGVWTDAYYMTTDEYLGSDYTGSGAFAFDREKMIAGDPTAGYVYFGLNMTTPIRRRGFLPSDLDGLRPPPPGTPGIFASYTATEYGDPADTIRLFEFDADFDDGFASTFTERNESPIAVAPFDPTSPEGRPDIAQPPPGEFLDSQSDRLNHRLAYRNFGSHESLVVNQTVRTSPIGSIYRAGVRVYELRNSAGGFQPFVDATIGDASVSRWIASAAQDHEGNLAVQYNLANEDKKPSILYTGRLADDPQGAFRTEATLIDGTGVQKAFGWRWGEYSGLSADPADDCTFWLTNAYYSQESEQWSDLGWLTRIGRFKFAECAAAPTGRLRGSIRNSVLNTPIANARFAVTPSTIQSAYPYLRFAGADGLTPAMIAPPGQYRVTASAPGFRDSSSDVTLPQGTGEPLTVALGLEPIPVFDQPDIEFGAESCSIDQAPEPGESVTINLRLSNTGAAPAPDLTATLIDGGGITNTGPPQNYGTIPVGGAATRPFSFRVAADVKCGTLVELRFRLQSPGRPIEELMLPIRAGRRKVAFSENFDSVAAPALPAGWTTTSSENHQLWRTSTNRTQSGPNSMFSPAPLQRGVNELISPAFQIDSSSAEIRFRNWYELETTFLRNRLYDGSVFEIKIGDADWQDIVAAGGQFIAGGYDGAIDACCQNPLAGRLGWSGRSGIFQASQFIDTIAKLPAAAAGQSVRLRWRIGTDIGTFREGQYIDDIVVTDGYSCECSSAAGRARFDFDGDGRTDIGVYRLNPGTDPDFRIVASSSEAISEIQFGTVGDLPAIADFDGDGKADVAIFRPQSGEWWITRSSDATVSTLRFGTAGDRVTPADFDGDGKADIAVYRPADGVWYIFQSSDGGVRIQAFGLPEDIPAAGDFDGDGRDDVAVFRPSNGVWYVYRSGGGITYQGFGLSGDLPTPGDFDGDEIDDIAVFRPQNGTWYLLRSAEGFGAVQFGAASDRPLQGDLDGDGRADIAVYRPSTAAWYSLFSSTGGVSVRQFGVNGDLPVPGIGNVP